MTRVSRGDLVIVATRGAYTSKPRPALVVQSDAFNPTHASVTIFVQLRVANFLVHAANIFARFSVRWIFRVAYGELLHKSSKRGNARLSRTIRKLEVSITRARHPQA